MSLCDGGEMAGYGAKGYCQYAVDQGPHENLSFLLAAGRKVNGLQLYVLQAAGRLRKEFLLCLRDDSGE